MKNDIILKISNLEKEYGSLKAVDRISFDVKAGEIVGLLGPNGAGKTTTINMILGVLTPTSGSIKLMGEEINHNRSRTNGLMNFAAVYAHLPGNLTVWQNLYVQGLLYNIDNLKERIDGLLREFDLVNFAETKVGLLSSGEQSQVNLVKATMNKPRLLLLDEPTASIDPNAASLIRERISRYAAEKQAGILWTSHNMHEIEAVCDRVLFMSHGRILLEGDPRTLPAERGKRNLEELFIAVVREPLTLEE